MNLRTLLTLAFVVVAVGCAEPAPENPPCCSMQDVIAMHQADVDDDLIIASLRASEVPLEPSAQDLIALSDAGVSKRVVQVMVGQDSDPAPAEPTETGTQEAGAAGTEAGTAAPAAAPAVAKAPAKPKGPPPLSLMVAYTPGDKKMVLHNTGGTTYTGLVLTANGEYIYSLPVPLPPGNPDGIRLGSFMSRATGQKLHHAVGLQKLHIKAQQGTWSKQF